ncbi:MAG: DUF4142 domain-containing protein [Gemmatimonadota bacterium]
MRSTQGATVPRPTDTSVATSSTAGLRDTTGYGNNPNKSRDTLQGNQPVTPPARTPSPSGAAGLSAADRQFVETAGNGGLAEVVLGCLAKQRATNPQVKEFAQRMIDDHSKANQQLMQLSVQKGVTLALQLQGDPKAAMDKLSGLTGAAFDKAYMNDMVSDHQQDVAAFEHESTGGQDADTKALATQTLPTLRQHLELAQQVNAAVK